MKREIDSRMAIAAVIVVLVLAGGAYLLMGQGPKPISATEVYSKKVLSDPDPPRPGQPGYHGHSAPNGQPAGAGRD